MKNNIDFEKFCEYMSDREMKKYEVVDNNIDWDNLYETADSYDDIVFNF